MEISLSKDAWILCDGSISIYLAEGKSNYTSNANGEVELWDVGLTNQWPLAFLLVINFRGDLFLQE